MSKKSREAIRNNLATAISPPSPHRKRGANLDGLLDEYAPPDLPAPTPHVAPPHGVPPTPDTAPPKTAEPPLQNVAAPPDVAPPLHVEATRYTSVPNDIFDAILPTLKPVEQSVLLRLYRLTRGFQNDRCTVSIGTLAKRCSVGTTAARNATQELERRGFIKRLGSDLANPSQDLRGVEFEMLLPAAAPTRAVAPPRHGAAVRRVAPPSPVANKYNDLKESNINTPQPPVDPELHVRALALMESGEFDTIEAALASLKGK
jgi:hypothetical protein